MARTIYASFEDRSDAEKAAGALLDHGVRSEDISLIQHGTEDEFRSIQTTAPYGTERTDYNRAAVSTDQSNDMVDAGEGTVAGTKSVGNRIAEYGNRAAGGISDAVGADDTAAGFRAAAEERDARADAHAARAGAEFRDATDTDNNVSDVSAESNTGMNTTNSTNYGEVRRDLNDVNYNRGTSTGGYDEDRDRDEDDNELSAKSGISTTTAADAGSGAAKGAGIGLGVGIAAALTSLFVPGAGIVWGAGALAAALGGVAATTGAGALAGAVTGYLKDQGVDDDMAVQYDQTIQAGGALLAVNVPSGDCDEAEAQAILAKYGAGNLNAYEARTAA